MTPKEAPIPDTETETQAPWSFSVSLAWRPELRFYDSKTAILERLGKEGLRRAFRISDEGVSALLTADFHEATVSDTGAAATAYTRRFDSDQLTTVLGVVLELIRPEAIGQASVSIQHVYPLQGDYAELRRRGAERLLRDGLAARLAGTDFALLLDGEWETGKESTYQVEFGLVNKNELRDRLPRRAGRMTASGHSRFGFRGWEKEELPEVGLFADSVWRAGGKGLPDTIGAEWLQDLSRRAGEAAVELLGTLLEVFESDADG